MSAGELGNGESENSRLEQAAKVIGDVANDLAIWHQAHSDQNYPACVFRAVSREITRLRDLRDACREAQSRLEQSPPP